MHPDAVPSAEWIPLEAPSGRIKDRMKVQVTTNASASFDDIVRKRHFNGRVCLLHGIYPGTYLSITVKKQDWYPSIPHEVLF